MALPLVTPDQFLHRGTVEAALNELEAILGDASCWRVDHYEGQPEAKVTIASRDGEERVRAFWERLSAVLHRQ